MGGRLKAVLLLAAMYGMGAASGLIWQTYRMDQPGMHHQRLVRRIRKLKYQLGLTADQEQALKKIIQNAQERSRELHEEVSPDFTDIHEESVQAIRSLLTPPQQATFNKLHQQSHES